jgi:hypothetical protein
MGRVKDWLIEMEEDALCMTRQEWCAKYGEHLSPVFDEVQERSDETSDKSGN